MSVFFNTSRVLSLIDALSEAERTLTTAIGSLEPTIATAGSLMERTGPTPTNYLTSVSDLREISQNLAIDRLDLETRLDALIEADQRTAYMLVTRSRSLLQPQLVLDALSNGWTYAEAQLRSDLDELRSDQRPLTRAQIERIRQLENYLAQIELPFSTTGTRGDLDSNLDVPRIGVPLRIAGDDRTERGRQLVIRALADTANPDQILTDEFEAFLHENGNLTIVLPGVIDLSDPHWGYDEESESLRDLDRQGIRSAFFPGTSNNAYAQRVHKWVELMINTGVIEPQTPTAIMGHSFGGETAFDLASDDSFNGDLVNVTHVFSAGYDNAHQFDGVHERTTAVAVHNIYDIAVLGEATLRHGWQNSTSRIQVEVAEATVNTVGRAVNTTVDRIEDEMTEHLHTQIDIGDIPELELVGDSYHEVGDNGLLISFEGAFDTEGAGHHQRFYEEFLETADDPHFVEFLEGLAAAGYTSPAVAVSVDVSRERET